MYNNYDDYDDYGYDYGDNQHRTRKFSLRNLTLKGKLIAGSILLLLIIILLVIINNIRAYYNSYEYFESQMVKKAQEYINNKANMLITDEIYLDLSTLNMEPPKTCSQISGVFIDSNYEYQAYLSCDDYQSNVVKNDTSKVRLNGEDVVLLAKGINYVEAGISGYFDYNIQGDIGSEEGVYNLNYIVLDNNAIIANLKRKVVIVDNIYVKNLFPTLTILGDKITYVEKGHEYVDKGVVASDHVDLDLTSRVKTDGKVNIYEVGEYEITYTVTNSRGYANYVKRTVVVINSFSTTIATANVSPTTLTNQNVTINLSVFGNKYSHVVLPDGTTKYDKNLSFSVSKNGVYNFFFYDQDGKSFSKAILVNNIDKVKPNAVCLAQVYSNYTNITVTPYSGKKISGYKYIVDGISTNYLTSSTYRASLGNIKKASIEIKDSINNTATIDCTVKYMDPTIGNNNVKYYTAFGQEYVIPKTKNDLDTFISLVRNKISQSADVENCGDSCLSFAQYHAYVLQYGDMYNMDLYQACNYHFSSRLDIIYTGTDAKAKQEALKLIYDEIFAGRVIVIQVTGTAAKNSRHFGVVVGYRRKVYSASDLKEDDLIYIDAWGGNLRTLDPSIDSHRIMFNDIGRGGWRVDRLK